VRAASRDSQWNGAVCEKNGFVLDQNLFVTDALRGRGLGMDAARHR
jgi:hypothetical protein